MGRDERLKAAIAEASGVPQQSVTLRPTTGGSINRAALAEVEGGRTFFCKWNDRPLARQFGAEAAGLAALRAAKSGLRVPEAIAFDDSSPGESFLVIEYLHPGTRGPGFDEALGRGLAALHRCADRRGFGFESDGYCGATPQPNPWTHDWPTFYRDHRIAHQVRLAKSRGMPTDGLRALDRLLDRLPSLLTASSDAAPSALIHGDLWSGNLIASEDGPALVDPAAYFGHREAELGMMTLFGGFSPRVYDAYREAWPLFDGWRDRQDLYALYHLLNHYHLFGGGYGDAAVRIARRYAGGP